MKLSLFGAKYSARSGIVELMDDLGSALQVNPDLISMGGGSPARIAPVQAVFQKILQSISADAGRVDQLLGHYQPPQGDARLLGQVADFLRVEYGWQVRRENIAISNGGQSAFFILANMLAGRFDDGS
ncbi:MAG: valine--pyruvate transaminase, partial [Pseudohongiellaceae bacterium]